MKKLLFFISLLTIFFSCDQVDCPNEVGCIEPDCPFGVDTLEHNSEPKVDRTVLILEYTGFTCNNCPEGAAEIQNLLDKNGDKLIAVSVHSGQFAEPGTYSGHDYLTDFRTEAGDELQEKFQPIGYPTAVINMKSFDGRYQNGRTAWDGIINSELSNTLENLPQLTVSSYYSEKFNTIYADADIVFPNDGDKDSLYNVMFLLIEDEVEDVQLDGPNYIENYIHKHVLRTAFGKTFGSSIPANPIVAEESYNVKASCTELDKTWDISKLEVVAIVYKSKTFEVVQAQKVHVK